MMSTCCLALERPEIVKIINQYPIIDPRLGKVKVIEAEHDGHKIDVYENKGNVYARADRGDVYEFREPVGLLAWLLALFGRR